MTYHIHTLTHKGEEVAEAGTRFQQQRQAVWTHGGGAYDINNSLKEVINNKTVLQSQIFFLSLIDL